MNHLVRLILLSTDDVTAFAGTGSAGSANDQRTAATFDRPIGIAMDAAGTFALIVSGKRYPAVHFIPLMLLELVGD